MARKRTYHRDGPVIALSILTAASICSAPAVSVAQTNQLRVMPQLSSPRLPSAEQQLNRTIDRQRSGFSTKQQIETKSRLNRSEQINRQNMQPDISAPPCPGGNEACQQRK